MLAENVTELTSENFLAGRASTGLMRHTSGRLFRLRASVCVQEDLGKRDAAFEDRQQISAVHQDQWSLTRVCRVFRVL